MRILMSESTWSDMTRANDLRNAGYLVSTAANGEDMLHHARTGQQDIVLLGTDCPGDDTGSLIRGLAFLAACPVVVIGATADPAQRAAWLNAGADACLPEHTETAELVVRLVALTRRAAGYATPQLHLDALCLDMSRKRATVHNRAMRLSRIEYELLEMLLLRQGHLLRRDDILSHIYAFEQEPEPRIIDVYICRLRARIAALGGDASMIQTHFGQGYRICAPIPLAMAA